MNDGNDWHDHQQLMEDGFSNYAVQRLVYAGDCLGTVEIISGNTGNVELLANADFSYALAPGENPELVFSEPGFVYAPIVQGQEAGFAYVCLNGKTVGKIPLIFGQTVEMESIEEPSLWEKLFKGGKS